jgi:hypothetical protein
MERQIGLYPITKVISPNMVELKLPTSFKIHPVIRVSCLWPYKPPTIEAQQTTPQSPVEIEGHPEYEVEKIMDSQLQCHKLEFLVKWKGYTEENNSWEPKDNCTCAHKAITHFYRKYPNAPRRIARMEYGGLTF